MNQGITPREVGIGAACAGASGVVLAIATSGGILGERLSSGDPFVAAAVDAYVTAVCVAFAFLLPRSLSRLAMVAQAVGAVVGIGVVHLALRAGALPSAPWLAETAPQLVNDLTAAFATLLLLWACVRSFDVKVFAVALLLVSLYRATASRWHLDVAPQGFAVSVQQAVVAQFIACAVGLLVFTWVARRNVGARAGSAGPR